MDHKDHDNVCKQAEIQDRAGVEITIKRRLASGIKQQSVRRNENYDTRQPGSPAVKPGEICGKQ